MMKKIILALVFCWIICTLGGCVRDAIPAVSDESSIQAETFSLAETQIETGTQTETETLSEAETSAVPRLTEAESISDPQTQPGSSAAVKSETAAASESETSAKSKPVESPPEPSATTAKKPADETSARLSLKDKIQSLREKYTVVQKKNDPAFFDDAVFVGDSVTQGLRNYVKAQRNKGNPCLGTASFLCCGSMGYTNALSEVSSQSMHPTYKGKKVTIESGIQLCDAKKLFIMLGMNDFSAYRNDKWRASVQTLFDRIEKQNPNLSIYVQSVTPIISGMEHGRFKNENIQTFNAYLEQVCRDRDYTYVDIYSVLADDSGHLKKAYCGDPTAMGIHMSNAGSKAWAAYLQTTFCGDAA